MGTDAFVTPVAVDYVCYGYRIALPCCRICNYRSAVGRCLCSARCRTLRGYCDCGAFSWTGRLPRTRCVGLFTAPTVPTATGTRIACRLRTHHAFVAALRSTRLPLRCVCLNVAFTVDLPRLRVCLLPVAGYLWLAYLLPAVRCQFCLPFYPHGFGWIGLPRVPARLDTTLWLRLYTFSPRTRYLRTHLCSEDFTPRCVPFTDFD